MTIFPRKPVTIRIGICVTEQEEKIFKAVMETQRKVEEDSGKLGKTRRLLNHCAWQVNEL